MYSTEEMVDVVVAGVQMDCSPKLAMRLCASHHSDCRVPMFMTIFDHFHTTGSVHQRREPKTYVVDEGFKTDVLTYVNLFPGISVRQIS